MKTGIGVVLPALLLLAGLAGCGNLGMQTGAPDLVLLNGKVVTVDGQFSVAEAVAVKGMRIVAVGKTADIRSAAGTHTRVIDLGGRTVIPGLIDNHTHAIRAAERWSQEARIDGVTSRQQALNIISSKARAARPGEWVLVLGGWTEDQFVDGKGGFTRAELDAAAPDNPVFAQVLFARGYANSLALKAAGLDQEDPARTAVLPPPAIAKVHGKIPPITREQWMSGLRTLMADYNRVGLTSVLDVGGNGFTPRHYEPVAELDKTKALDLRFIYLQYMRADNPQQADEAVSYLHTHKPFRGSDYFRVIGIGENVYGPTTDNTYRPFKPDPVHSAAWLKIATAAATGGWHIQQHATHDSTIADFLTQIETINASTPVGPLRWTLAHVDGISAANIERLRKLGMGVTLHSRPSIQGQMVLKRWGDAGYNMPSLRRIQDSGLIWGLGSDTTIVAPYNPFYSLWWAVTGKMLDGTKVNEHTVTREQALIAHTRSNAYFLFMERQLGSIEPGKYADLVVLDHDYLTVPADRIRDLKPVMTMVGGKVVYEAK